MRGRPRKPAKVLEMSGAYRKNPARRRARAAELTISALLGEPPAEWTARAQAEPRFQSLLETWRQVVRQDVLHVLNASHWLLVKNVCLLQYKIDRALLGYGKASSGDYSTLRGYLAAIGQTPADSARVAEAVRLPDRSAVGQRKSGTGWGEFSA